MLINDEKFGWLYVLPWDGTDDEFIAMAIETLPMTAIHMISQESHQFFVSTDD